MSPKNDKQTSNEEIFGEEVETEAGLQGDGCQSSRTSTK